MKKSDSKQPSLATASILGQPPSPLTEQLNDTASGAVNTKSSVQSLITLERAQKLDLLMHLIANLRQSLVLCGPGGIGKSTILELLQKKKSESWLLCSIVATKQLSFELVQRELLRKFHDTNVDSQDVHECLQQFQLLNQKIVLIIDDAGQLVPGLITVLCQFSMANPNLRIIFALTPDELHIKNSSDKIIDGCHFIDIPPLSEKQSGEFLQNLSRKPGATLSFKAVSPAMIEKIYRETHGIPGKIVDMQRGVSRIKHSSHRVWIYILIFSVLVTAGISMLLLQQSNKQFESVGDNVSAVLTRENIEVEILPPVVNKMSEILTQETIQLEQQNSEQDINIVQTPQVDVVDEISLPVPVHPQSIAPAKVMTEPVNLEHVESIHEASKKAEPKGIEVVAQVTQGKTNARLESEKEQTIEADAKVDNQQISTNQPVDKSVEILKPEKIVTQNQVVQQKLAAIQQKPINKQSEKLEERKPPKNDLLQDGIQWVLDQPPKNYTLQLMSLEKQQTLTKVISKHSNLKKHFHVYKSNKKGKTRFVLLYGSFLNSKQASKAIKVLPAVFKPPWKRRFRTLQKEVKANITE